MPTTPARILILTFIIFFAAQVSFSQTNPKDDSFEWEIELFSENPDFDKIVAAFDEEWKGKAYKKGAGIKPFKRWQHFYEQRMGDNHKMDLKKAKQNYDRYKAEQSARRSSPTSEWEFLGPRNVPATNNGIGRINVIAFPPSQPNHIWVGAPAGGLWTSTDNGNTWSTTTDTLPFLGVSDIAFHPTISGQAYIATGDRDHSDAPNIGVLKTTDGGQTWSSIGLDNPYRINRLLINPSKPNHFLAATSTGIYKTYNEGASWQLITSGHFRHMEFMPGDTSIVYATKYANPGEMYRSADGGITFNPVTLPAATNTPRRLAIAVTPGNIDAVYLLAGYNDPGGSNDFAGIYKSTDRGVSFVLTTQTSPPSLGSQMWYDWAFAVDPSDENTMLAGGVGLRKSTDNGDNWAYSTNGIHVDFHHLTFHPVTNELFAASDGGIYKSNDAGTTWTSLCDGIEITQYYRLGTSDINPFLLFAGSQDNGTHRLLHGEWEHVMGGDGMEAIADYSDENIAYAEYQYGHVRRSEDGGNSYTSIFSDGTSNENGPWVTPYEISPADNDIILIGHQTMWRSDDAGNTWTNPSSAIFSSQSMLSIAYSPSDPSIVYASECDSVYRSSDGGLTWTKQNTFTLGCAKDLAVDPTDPNTLVFADWSLVRKSTDAGVTWVNYSDGLPNISMNTIAYQPGTDGGMYVGTDAGVYYRNNTMSSWVPFEMGLPNVEIAEIEIDPCFNKIRVATFGRGIWENELYERSDLSVCCENLKIPMQVEDFECGDTELKASVPKLTYPTGYTKTWFLDGNPISSGNDTLIVTQSGNYAFRIVNQSNNNCSSSLNPVFVNIDSCSFRVCNTYNSLTANGPGNLTTINMSTSMLPALSDIQRGNLVIRATGDLDGAGEKFNILNEDMTLLGITPSQSQCSGYSFNSFPVTSTQINSWGADGFITAMLDPTTVQINPALCPSNQGCLELQVILRPICQDSIHFSGDITTNLNETAAIITSDARVRAQSNTLFNYSQYVALEPNFQTDLGALFEVKKGNCRSTNGGSSLNSPNLNAKD